MISKYRQHGLGMAGWLILILVFGSMITIGAKLLPLYLDHNTMSKVLDGIAEEPGMAGKYSTDLTALVIQRFKLNNIRDFDVKKHLEIVRERTGVRLVLDYEVRTPLIHNVDLIASFEKSVDLKE